MNKAGLSGILKNNYIAGWDDLAKLIEFFSSHNGDDWLFRGVSSHDHKLVPKVGRPTRKIKGQGRARRSLPYTEPDEIAIFNQFRDVSMPFLPRPPSTEIEWLALAQHHGLPTRFLDWTQSLLVAAWFAVGVYEPGARARAPAIWVVRDVPRVIDAERDNVFTIKEPRSYRPPHLSPRIAAQSSVLTIHGTPTRPFTHSAMWQFRIARHQFFTLKKRIDACGINERTLFPGLDGIAKDLAWRYKNNYLAGYR